MSGSVQERSKRGKKCTSCRKWKPLSQYYKQNGKPKARCKECVKAWHNQYYHQTKTCKDKASHPIDQPKRCPQCGEIKPPEQFVIKTVKLVSGEKQYLKECKECNCAAVRRYYQEHREERNTYDKKRRSTDEHKEREAARWAHYYAEKRKEILARISSPEGREKQNVRQRRWRATTEGKGRQQEYRRRYRERNPERAKMLSRLGRERRRSRLNGVECSLMAVDVLTMLEFFDGKCAYCSTDLGVDYALDHIVPLLEGGPTTPPNLVPCCITCNSRKHTKPLDVFLRRWHKETSEAVMEKIAEYVHLVS